MNPQRGVARAQLRIRHVFTPTTHHPLSSLLPFFSREVPKSQRHHYGATRWGAPTAAQKRRDSQAIGISQANTRAARKQVKREILDARCEAAKLREVVARAAGTITPDDEEAAKKLEPMYEALKKGGGYEPRYSSMPGAETRWPTSAMDIVLQRKADGKDENSNWRGLSKTWSQAYSTR